MQEEVYYKKWWRDSTIATILRATTCGILKACATQTKRHPVVTNKTALGIAEAAIVLVIRVNLLPPVPNCPLRPARPHPQPVRPSGTPRDLPTPPPHLSLHSGPAAGPTARTTPGAPASPGCAVARAACRRNQPGGGGLQLRNNDDHKGVTPMYFAVYKKGGGDKKFYGMVESVSLLSQKRKPEDDDITLHKKSKDTLDGVEKIHG